MPSQADEAVAAINRAIALIRAANKSRPSRAKALALTNCEQALHWLWADAMAAQAKPVAIEENAR